MQLNPNFFSFKVIYYFSYYFSEKTILTDQIPAFINRALKLKFLYTMTKFIGILVGLLVMSSKDTTKNTQDKFDCVLSVEKIYLGYMRFIFIKKGRDF